MGALIIVEQARFGLPRIEMPGQLQHVVAVAAFAGLFGDMLGNGAGIREIFPVGIAADDIAILPDHGLPEEVGGNRVGGIAGDLVQARKADQLGNLGIGVDPGQAVLPLGQRIEHLAMAQPRRQRQPARIAGAGVKFGEAFIDAAMLAVQHLLHLCIVQFHEHAVDIGSQGQCNATRLAVAQMGFGVEQAGEQLVPIIEGHPAAVEVEAGRSDVAAHDLRKDQPAILDHIVATAGEARDIAIAGRRLALGQFGDDIGGAAGAFGVAGLGVHQRQRGQIMAQRMAGDGIIFPAAIDGALGRQAGMFAEIVQQPVRLQPQQIEAIALDRVGKGGGEKPGCLQRQGARRFGQRTAGRGMGDAAPSLPGGRRRGGGCGQQHGPAAEGRVTVGHGGSGLSIIVIPYTILRLWFGIKTEDACLSSTPRHGQ